MGNENTRFVWARPEFYAFGEIPPAAWQVNGTYLNLKRQEHMDSWALGAVAMWKKRNGNLAHAYGVAFSPIEDIPAALVLGRHSQCDVSLETSCSLRHVLVTAYFDEERPRLNARDLNTAYGFGVGETGPVKRATCFERGRLTLGTAEIRLFTAPPHEKFKLNAPWYPDWKSSLPPAGVKERHAQEVASVLAEDEETVRLAKQLDAARQQDKKYANVDWADAAVFGFRDRTGQIRSFRSGKLVCLEQPAAVSANLAQLKDGLLLGRYLRCAGSGNLSGFKRASRVHCLVQLRREKLWLFDTASTNGTVVQKANGSQVVVNADCPVHRLGLEDVVSIGGREVSLIF